MIKMLSIDFDYLVDADFNTRIYKFPDGIDNIPPIMNKLAWDDLYERYPELKDIKIRGDYYDYLTEYLVEKIFVKGKKVLFASSHADIQKLLDKKEEIELVHVDHHHDLFFGKGHFDYNCAIWLRQEIYVLHRLEVDNITWVANEDSQISCLVGNAPFKTTTDIKEVINDDVEFDEVFICLSPEWTPPHLYKYFKTWKNVYEICKPQ